MLYIQRSLEKTLRHHLSRGKSILLLGPRQFGKTTLLSRLSSDLIVSFVTPKVRLRYEQKPDILSDEIASLNDTHRKRIPLVILDEVQKVPGILDVVQDLIDRNVAQFILTGSSARKLKRGREVNLLPGRIVSLRLDPFVQSEIPRQSLEASLILRNIRMHLRDMLYLVLQGA